MNHVHVIGQIREIEDRDEVSNYCTRISVCVTRQRSWLATKEQHQTRVLRNCIASQQSMVAVLKADAT